MEKSILDKKTIVYAIGIISSVVWGMTYFGTEVVIEKFTVLQVLAGRWTISMVAFIAMAITGIIKVDFRGKKIWKCLLVAMAQPCLFSLGETYGVALTSTSETSIMSAMVPVTVLVLATIIFKQKNPPVVLFGVALSFAGVVIAIASNGEGFGGGKATGYLFLILMVVAGSIFTLGSRSLKEEFTPVEITFMQAVAGGIWFNCLAFGESGTLSWYADYISDMRMLAAIVFLGLFGSCICYIVFHYVVSKIPPAQASMLQVNIITLTGMVSGILILGDPFTWKTILGLLMVLGGVLLANKTDEHI